MYTVQLGGVIIAFDTLTNRSLPEIILPSTTSGGDRVPTNALYDPLNGYLYVSTLGTPYNSDPGSILAINTTTGRVVENMTSVMEPGGLALDTTDNLLFVGGIYDGTGIQVFDLADKRRSRPSLLTAPSQMPSSTPRTVTPTSWTATMTGWSS
jgi:hypothetical protein